MSELFEFSPEKETHITSGGSWVVLSVEDDTSYQDVLEIALQGVTYDGRSITLLRAPSAASASTILSSRHDISVILLDIVMETDDAGFYLINTIRNIIGDDLVRIIVLTGQPGVMSHNKAISEYNISEYWNKTELSAEKLKSVVVSNLRTWQISQELSIARRGLQLIVDASRALTAKQDTKAFSQTVLEEISRIINVPDTGGIVCIVNSGSDVFQHAPIVAASSHFKHLLNYDLKEALNIHRDERRGRIEQAALRAWEKHEHVFEDDFSLLHFDTSEHNEKQYLMLVDSPNPLDNNQLYLLQAFAENISSGFINQALMSKLSQLAYLDTSTALQNKNWLIRELTQQSVFHLNNSSLVLFRLLDYDTAEMIAGHEYAIKMFKTFSNFIKAKLPDHYLMAVWDKKTIALVFTLDKKPAKDVLESMQATTMEMDELDIQLQYQIGILDFRDTQTIGLSEVLVLADTALSKARKMGLKIYSFDFEVIRRLSDRMHILNALQSALTTQDAFFLVLQPKVKLENAKPIGFEALLRWKLEDGTLCPPSEFIPIAEASGLSLEVSELVLAKTIEIIKQLKQAGFQLPVSFNLANSDIVSPSIFKKINSSINKGDIDPALLEIEVTETQATEDYAVINPILRSLIEKGVKVSIDDFGTGYSSLTQFAELAATTIKLDRKFVSDLSAQSKDKPIHIIQMIARLSERFGFDLIAEGVETEEQRQLLLDNGYKYAQGYYFAKPMPVAEVFEWLRTSEK